MTAVGYGDDSPEAQAKFEKYWPADLHIVGKEIIRFHCVYWPAFLMAAGLPLPKAIVAHGWLLFDDTKMSKSKGNIVRTETILDAFGTLCPPSAQRQRVTTASAGEAKDPAFQPDTPTPSTTETSSPPTSSATSSCAKSPSARTAASPSKPSSPATTPTSLTATATSSAGR